MAVLRFPRIADRSDGPQTVHLYVCAPSHEDLLPAARKYAFGHSRKEASLRFYEGGINGHVETKTGKLENAAKWFKLWLFNQLEMHVLNGQPLSPIEEEAREILGRNPDKYGKRLRRPKRATAFDL